MAIRSGVDRGKVNRNDMFCTTGYAGTERMRTDVKKRGEPGGLSRLRYRSLCGQETGTERLIDGGNIILRQGEKEFKFRHNKGVIAQGVGIIAVEQEI